MATVADSHVTSRHHIKPHQTNSLGNAHGGSVVMLMDELAAISASEIAEHTCVTAHISDIDFHHPIPGASVVELEAFVVETGTTSLTVYVNVESRPMDGNQSTETTNATFTMVAVDEDENPVEVPDVSAETDFGEELLEKV